MFVSSAMTLVLGRAGIKTWLGWLAARRTYTSKKTISTTQPRPEVVLTLLTVAPIRGLSCWLCVELILWERVYAMRKRVVTSSDM